MRSRRRLAGLGAGGALCAAAALVAGVPAQATSARVAPAGLTVDGDAAGLLYPGGPAVPIRVTLRNSDGVDRNAVRLSVAVVGLPTRCETSDFRIRPSDLSGSNALTVPAHGSVTLPAGGVSAPSIRLLDVGAEDACAGARITLRYSVRTGVAAGT